MPVLVAAGQGQHRGLVLSEADGRFADGDSAGIWPNAIQHSVTEDHPPTARRPMLHQGAVRLGRNDQDVAVQAQLLGVVLTDVGVISVQAGSGNWMR
jgi:hypothetical protein